jgi:hypothetical protein
LSSNLNLKAPNKIKAIPSVKAPNKIEAISIDKAQNEIEAILIVKTPNRNKKTQKSTRFKALGEEVETQDCSCHLPFQFQKQTGLLDSVLQWH